MIYLDTETALIEPGVPAPPLVCVQLAVDGGPVEVLNAADGIDLVSELLRPERAQTFCGHRLPYDLGVLIAASPEGALVVDVVDAMATLRLVDTGIGARLIDIARGEGHQYSLAACCQQYSVAEKRDPQGWRLRFSQLAQRPISDWPSAALDYAAGDVESTRELYYALRACPELHGEELRRQTAYSSALHLLTLRGMTVDPDAVVTANEQLFAIRQRARTQLQSAGLLRQDGSRDLGDIRGRVAAAYDSPPLTDGGKPRTDRVTLQESGDEDLVALAKIGTATTSQTLLRGLQSRRGIVTAGYDGPKRSGRYSTRGPNLTQLPRRGPARGCLVARKGCTLLAADYSQIELCALAQICLDERLGSDLSDAINSGKDLHVRTGGFLLAGGITDDPAAARQIGKIANYGAPAGLTSRSLATQIASATGASCSVPRAAEVLVAQGRAFPSVPRYLGWAQGQALQKKPAVIRGSGRARQAESWLALANTRFQGLVADGALAAVVRVCAETYGAKGALRGKAWPVLFAHDEIVLEVLVDAIDDARRVVETIMISAMAGVIPDVAIRVESRVARRWGK